MTSSIEDGLPRQSYPQTASVQVRLPASRPLVTYVLIGINALVWLAMTLMGGSENPRVLLLFGAKYNPLIVAGQYWRLLTACFIHIGLMHLLFNGYALLRFGFDVESRYGHARFLMIYLLSGLMGSVLSFLGNPSLSAGASGAIFGLIGAVIAFFVSHRDEFGAWGRRRLSSLLVIAGYNLVFGLANPGIDNLGHIGGLIAGLALGWALSPEYRLALSPSMGSFQAIAKVKAARAWSVTLGVALLLVAMTALGVRLQG